jgi:hypothetical protein
MELMEPEKTSWLCQRVKPLNQHVDGLRSENRDLGFGIYEVWCRGFSPISRMLNWNYWDDQDPSSRKNSGPTLQRFWWTPDIVCLGVIPIFEAKKEVNPLFLLDVSQ